MGIYDDDLWQTTSSDVFADKLKESLGEAAWVDAYARYMCAKGAKSERFAFQVLRFLGWHDIVKTIKPQPSLMAHFYVQYVNSPLKTAQKHMSDAVDNDDSCAFLFWHSLVEAIENVQANYRRGLDINYPMAEDDDYDQH